MVTRREFLRRTGVVTAGLAMPACVRADRPAVTHGVQSGEVTADSAVVWARADRASMMLVETAPTESFARSRLHPGPMATAESDFTAKLDLRGLPPGQEVWYRVSFEERGVRGEPAVGRLRTAPAQRQDVRFVWSGDTCGQGWGINPEFGGLRMYETMRGADPDFFIHSGDTVYADAPLEERRDLPDGGVWRNVVTPEKAKVAETLDEFRGQHRYNLTDEHVRRFNARVPVFAQWDDHETTNNWWPGELLDDERYTVRQVDVLAARGRQAFFEYLPLRGGPPDRIERVVRYGPSLDVFFLDMRTDRGRNDANDQPAGSPILGARQLDWLKRELERSTATWKVMAADMPLGIVVRDGDTAFEGVANGQGGPPLGREREVADLLTHVKRRGIGNLVWLTADVHYTAAHRYDPGRAAIGDFDPFWEFVSGPIHAGTGDINELDPTFGPEVVFAKAADAPGLGPAAGLQFFGEVAIAGDTEVMTVRLRDLTGTALYEVTLEPTGERQP
ncbi:MAG: alkaline phosphatase D family protein [Egibacteraceae bacterium]